MLKHFFRTVLVGVLSISLSQPVFAGGICTGKVTVTLTPAGSLLMSLAGPGVNLYAQALCSTNPATAYNGIDAAACKSIYSMLLTAKVTDRNVMFWYDYAATSVQCDATRFTPWTVMSTTAPQGGWYFGPEMQ